MQNSDPDRQMMNQYAGRRMELMRKDLALTQAELAELLSFEAEKQVDHKTIYRWEKGQVTVPAWALCHLQLICDEFKTTQHQLNVEEFVKENQSNLVFNVLNKVRGWLKGKA